MYMSARSLHNTVETTVHIRDADNAWLERSRSLLENYELWGVYEAIRQMTPPFELDNNVQCQHTAESN